MCIESNFCRNFRTWLVLLLVSVVCLGCDDDTAVNYPSLQGNKDGVLWQSITQEAENALGIMTIFGDNYSENLTLKVPSSTLGTFQLGATETSVAMYTGQNAIVYSTLFSPVDNPETPDVDESVVYASEGEITITDINLEEGFVSGNFWFTAYNSEGLDDVTFNQGVFYQVPFKAE